MDIEYPASNSYLITVIFRYFIDGYIILIHIGLYILLQPMHGFIDRGNSCLLWICLLYIIELNILAYGAIIVWLLHCKCCTELGLKTYFAHFISNANALKLLNALNYQFLYIALMDDKPSIMNDTIMNAPTLSVNSSNLQNEKFRKGTYLTAISDHI